MPACSIVPGNLCKDDVLKLGPASMMLVNHNNHNKAMHQVDYGCTSAAAVCLLYA